MFQFLKNNRQALIDLCTEAVARRPRRVATPEQLKNGVPLFLDQLTGTLEAEVMGLPAESLRISGNPGGDADSLSEIGEGATAHGRQLLELGYTVDQVVHDYGDLCQAITSLAVDRDAPFSVDEFRTLNRCLDNAIADAVVEFSAFRDTVVADRQSAEVAERVGFLVHELRNHLHTAQLASHALSSGALPMAGATGKVLQRSLASMSTLLVQSVESVRASASREATTEVFTVAAFIADAANAARLDAKARGCVLVVKEVDEALCVKGHREPLVAALVNLLHNGFKFTRAHTDVTLDARLDKNDSVLIEVSDHCGGLGPGAAQALFMPFIQSNSDRTGLGLGLSIAKRSVEADGGALSVRDVPGMGCVFTIRLPCHTCETVEQR